MNLWSFTKKKMAVCEIVLVFSELVVVYEKPIAVCEIVVVFGELVVVYDKENRCL